MKRSVHKMVEEYRLHWRHYVFQSLLATVAVFIVFTMPAAITAQARNVIGGYLVGPSSGVVFSLIPHPTLLLALLIYSAVVGVCIFVMVVTDTEHPLAAGAALGVAVTGASLRVFFAVILAAIVFSLIHRFLRPHLRDLTCRRGSRCVPTMGLSRGEDIPIRRPTSRPAANDSRRTAPDQTRMPSSVSLRAGALLDALAGCPVRREAGRSRSGSTAPPVPAAPSRARGPHSH